MSLLDALKGAAIRDTDGTRGHVMSTSPLVRVDWDSKSVFEPKVEHIPTADMERLKTLEVLTLREGWKPMAAILEGVKSKETSARTPPGLLGELAELLDEAKKKAKKSTKKKAPAKKKAKSKPKKEKPSAPSPKSGSHYPFKRKSTLDDGPKGRSHKRKNVWACSCPSKRTCKCKNKKTGEEKTIRINPSYQKSYNKCYKYFKKTRSKKYC